MFQTALPRAFKTRGGDERGENGTGDVEQGNDEVEDIYRVKERAEKGKGRNQAEQERREQDEAEGLREHKGEVEERERGHQFVLIDEQGNSRAFGGRKELADAGDQEGEQIDRDKLVPVDEQGDDEGEAGDGTQAVTDPQHVPLVHAVDKDARRRAQQQRRQAEADNGETYQGGRAGDFLDEHEQRVVRGIEDGHGNKLSQPEAQKIFFPEQGQKTLT